MNAIGTRFCLLLFLALGEIMCGPRSLENQNLNANKSDKPQNTSGSTKEEKKMLTILEGAKGNIEGYSIGLMFVTKSLPNKETENSSLSARISAWDNSVSKQGQDIGRSDFYVLERNLVPIGGKFYKVVKVAILDNKRGEVALDTNPVTIESLKLSERALVLGLGTNSEYGGGSIELLKINGGKALVDIWPARLAKRDTDKNSVKSLEVSVGDSLQLANGSFRISVVAEPDYAKGIPGFIEITPK